MRNKSTSVAYAKGVKAILDKVLASHHQLLSSPLTSKPAVKDLLCRSETSQIIKSLFQRYSKRNKYRAGIHHLLSWAGLRWCKGELVDDVDEEEGRCTTGGNA